MNKILFSLITLFSFQGVSAQAFTQEAPWKNVRDRNDIQVYNRSIEGSDFKEFMAQTTVNADLSTIIAVFEDTKAGIDWVENVDEMHTEKVISESETITVTLSKAPWPVADRDAVVLNKTTQNPDSLAVTLKQKGIPDYLPLKEGVVRVKSLTSRWVFTPVSDTVTHVHYQVLTDPGGKLPAWLINLVSVSQPYNSLLGLKEMVKQEKYQNRHFPHIVNHP
ncbi:START domain-containing protein [Photobacterium minamisatsumaniensis]|uniref:START domain-containing protein n=1 Tax=Photobacterium minamisatsumaniensis TaxID=2910233 RepID=UPI003D0F2755